jgi:hypothetical protein
MGFLDALFGKQKPAQAAPERLFAIGTAEPALEAEQGLTPTGSAALCFKGVASGPFQQMQHEVEALLHIAEQDKENGGITYRSLKDDLGYTWLIFESKDFQQLVSTVHIGGRTFLDQGYGSQLLFAIFGFKNASGHEMYWIYNYKRGTFYPFVPVSDSHDKQRRRDNPEELRLGTAMDKELPVEQQLETWYPVWDLPL